MIPPQSPIITKFFLTLWSWLSRNVYFLQTSRKRVIKACQGCAMPGSSRRFFKFWEVWVWGLSRVEEMQVEREEAGLGRWSRWRRWRLRTCAARPPPAISVLQYYFGPPPATPCLKYSSTQAFNKFSRSKIAGGPKNSHWFARLVLGLPRQTGWCCWSPWWWRPGGGGGRGEGVHTGEQLGKLGLHQGCVASCYSWGLSAAWSHLARLDLTTCCRQAPCQRCRLGSPGEELVLPPPFQLANLWPCHLLANKPTTPKSLQLIFWALPLVSNFRQNWQPEYIFTSHLIWCFGIVGLTIPMYDVGNSWRSEVRLVFARSCSKEIGIALGFSRQDMMTYVPTVTNKNISSQQ